MKCKCNKEMTMIIGDEFLEVYVCTCGIHAIKNIELSEESYYLKEV